MAVTGPRTGKLIVEIPYKILDDTWTEQDLIENAVIYIQSIVARAEQRNHDRFPKDTAYTLGDAHADDITVWTLDGYTADLNDLAEMKGD